MFLGTLFVFLFLRNTVFGVEISDRPCGDQIQRCAILIEEFERQINDVKAVAFRSCFSRSPDPFGDAAHSFRGKLGKCFETNDQMAAPDFASLLTDEDAIYGKAILGAEFADRLWDLKESEGSAFDGRGICGDLHSASAVRFFGSGSSRFADSSNGSCVFESAEIQCYRQFLDHDTQFARMLRNRDRTLRSCIQTVRSHRRCRSADIPRLRSCICDSRKELEEKLQSALSECTQRSPLRQLYREIVDKSGESGIRSFAAAPQRKQPKDGEATASTATSLDDSPQTTSMSISPGVVLNGQCLCACPGATAPTLFGGSNRQQQFSTDMGISGSSSPQIIGTPMAAIPTTPLISPIPTAPTDYLTIQQQRLQQQWQQQQREIQENYQRQQAQLMGQMYNGGGGGGAVRGGGGGGGGGRGSQRTLEAGISDGFERFFSGLPPIRRRARRHSLLETK